jgi:hypothetical protein
VARSGEFSGTTTKGPSSTTVRTVGADRAAAVDAIIFSASHPASVKPATSAAIRVLFKVLLLGIKQSVVEAMWAAFTAVCLASARRKTAGV